MGEHDNNNKNNNNNNNIVSVCYWGARLRGFKQSGWLVGFHFLHLSKSWPELYVAVGVIKLTI